MKTPVDYRYLAGFIDGDGCILAQIIKRAESKWKFEIRVSIVMYQKTSRHWFLLSLQKEIGGTLRKRNDNMSELAIVGRTPVSVILKELIPYLRMKKPTAELVMEIIESEAGIRDRGEFIEVCKKVDKIAEYTDSKRRTITAEVVSQHTI